MRVGIFILIAVCFSSPARAAMNFSCTSEPNGTQQVYIHTNTSSRPILTVVGHNDLDRESRCFEIARVFSANSLLFKSAKGRFECEPIKSIGSRIRIRSRDRWVTLDSKEMTDSIAQKVCESYAKQLTKNLLKAR